MSRIIHADDKHTKSYKTYARATQEAEAVIEQLGLKSTLVFIMAVESDARSEVRFAPLFNVGQHEQHYLAALSHKGHMVTC